MFIETVPNRTSPPAILLRESYRDEAGKAQKRTLANLSKLPASLIAGLKGLLKGGVAIPTAPGAASEEGLRIERSLPHGHVAAGLGMLRKSKLDRLLLSTAKDEHSRRCCDLAIGLMVDRLLASRSKLGFVRAINGQTASSSLGEVLSLGAVAEREVYSALDWLLEQQPRVESALARRLRATVRDGPRGPSLGLDQSRADQNASDHRAVEGVATLGRSPAFLVEDRGDLDAIAAGPMKFAGPGDEIGIEAEGFELGDRPHQFMRGSVTALPMALQANLFADADHGDDDPFEQEPSDRLTLLPSRRLGPPKGRQILGQILDGGQFGRARRLGQLPLKALVVGQEMRLLAERRLPILLQGAGHQPVLGLDAGVTASGLIDPVLRPFEALTPMLFERFALRLQIESRRQAGLDCRRLQRLQDKPRDLSIHRRGLQRLAGRRVPGRARADALVARRMAGVVVRGRHAQAAPAAHDQPGEQCGAGACGTPFARSIGADLLLIALELLPGYVGWQTIGQEHLGILPARRSSPAARVTGLMTTPVDRPAPIDVDAGIDRIAEQIPKRGSTRSAPFQFALARSSGQAHRHLDVVLYEVAQNAADRAHAVEQIEHKADHALRLLVGIERHFA